MPGDFIPLTEASGLINAIGAFVTESACRRAASWPDDIKVSINVSAIQLRSAALVSQLAQAMAAHRVHPSRIEIEITETALLERGKQAAIIITALSALGVRIAMDGFGTGYSSLVHLREFKVDRIKIDRSFVTALCEDAGSAAIVRAMMSMARELGIQTTAEGIEQDIQLETISALGCGTAQGYLLSRPLEEYAADVLVRPTGAGIALAS
nr:EAL domain-containing protein [Fulvimarina endophytica]